MGPPSCVIMEGLGSSLALILHCLCLLHIPFVKGGYISFWVLGFGLRVVASTCFCLSSSGGRHRPRLFWLYHVYCAFTGCRAHFCNICINAVVIDFVFYTI